MNLFCEHLCSGVFFEWKVGELRRKFFFFCKSLIKLSEIHFKLSEEKTQSEIEIAYVWQKLNASFDLNRCKPFVYSSLLSNI